MKCISCREYDIFLPHFYGGELPDSCFNWLKNLSLVNQKDGEKEFIKLISRRGQEALQIRNYVGLLQTPDGTCIEILPKTSIDEICREDAVKLLFKMLKVVYDLSAVESTAANLAVTNQPLIEILISQFLMHVTKLVHKGLRSDYFRINAQKYFLKGRLLALCVRIPFAPVENTILRGEAS